jgi:hypothetical protein
MIDKSKLVNLYGNPRLRDLFIDFATDDQGRKDAVYTLKYYDLEQDGKIYFSLYQLFMAQEDLTEWEFANKHLLGWDHWERLSALKAIKDYVEIWRRDLEQKIKSRAFKVIMQEAEEAGKNAFEANKLLLTGKWKELAKSVTESKRGRPSKAEVEGRAQEELNTHKALMEDMKRLGLDS